MRSVIVEIAVPLRDCPPGDWEPFVGRNEDGSVWGFAVTPITPFGRHELTGVEDIRGAHWICPPDVGRVIARPGEKLVVEKEIRGEVVILRLVRKTAVLVLYHANCWDGFCAAWVCHKVYPDAEFQAVHYGSQPPDVSGREVLIVDFSYPREQLLAMKESAESILVLDHHKTAEAALRDLAFCTFDLSKSGGRLAWEHFFPGQKSPGIVDYTEDRDLWLWQLPGSKPVNSALRSYPLDFKIWDGFGKLTALDLLERLVDPGEAILRAEAEIIRAHVRNAHEIELDGHKVLCVNATTLISEIAGELAKGRPFGVTWFEGDNNERVYSLRSTDDGVDVSAIAKAHGGGGHRNAAGFRAPATGATGLFTDGR